MNISNCVFNGVVWDKATLDTVHLVARGLVTITERTDSSTPALESAAVGLANLTDLFSQQHVNIECLMKIEPDVYVAPPPPPAQPFVEPEPVANEARTDKSVDEEPFF